MRQILEDQLDAIDAAVFSGDSMHDDDTRSEFRRLMARWEKEMKSIDAMQLENTKDNHE